MNYKRNSSITKICNESSAKSSRKRSHKTHDLTYRQCAVNRILNGETKAKVSRELNIPESTLRGWCKKVQQSNVMTSSAENSSSSSQSSNSLNEDPEINFIASNQLYVQEEPNLNSPSSQSSNSLNEDPEINFIASNQPYVQEEPNLNLKILNKLLNKNYTESNIVNQSFWQCYKSNEYHDNNSKYVQINPSLLFDIPIDLSTKSDDNNNERSGTFTNNNCNNYDNNNNNIEVGLKNNRDLRFNEALNYGMNFLNWMENDNKMITQSDIFQFKKLMNKIINKKFQVKRLSS